MCNPGLAEVIAEVCLFLFVHIEYRVEKLEDLSQNISVKKALAH